MAHFIGWGLLKMNMGWQDILKKKAPFRIGCLNKIIVLIQVLP
jgi:hypothetical protein